MDMRKKRKITILILWIILIIFSLSFILPKLIGYLVKAPLKQVQFYFYDEAGCPLDGYVFSGNKVIGKTQDGYFNLSYENYKANFNSQENISLFGRLGSCFNSDLLFDKYWEGFEIREYYFSGESLFNFKTKVDSHNPAKRELIGFVQAGKVNPELNKININGENTLYDLSKINQYLNDKISYAKDWGFGNETNYWQTPLETLELGEGDCEDFSVTLLSLFLAYNSSLNCYNIIFSSHVTTFCKIEDYYAYYDQEKTELKKQIYKNAETKIELKKLEQDYFEHYGISDSEMAYYAFNDNELMEFKSDVDFINWQYSLDKRAEFDLFGKLEQELSSIKFNETKQTEEAELRTEPAIELRTLRGFFEENSTMLIILGIILIFLVVILIKINFKKR